MEKLWLKRRRSHAEAQTDGEILKQDATSGNSRNKRTGESTRVRKVNQYQVKQVKLEQSKREGTTFGIKASKRKGQPVRLSLNNDKDRVNTMDKLRLILQFPQNYEFSPQKC